MFAEGLEEPMRDNVGLYCGRNLSELHTQLASHVDTTGKMNDKRSAPFSSSSPGRLGRARENNKKKALVYAIPEQDDNLTLPKN